MKRLLILLFTIATIGAQDYSLQFDGVDDWVEINSISNDINSNELTFDCLFKDDGYYGIIFGINHDIVGDENTFVVGFVEGQLWISYGNNINLSYDHNINDDNWHRIFFNISS